MRQAVIIIHGMGEQTPMSTLNSFVKSVWTTDSSLVDPRRPDPNTGRRREGNAAWSKPDDRNNSTELRRIATERDVNGNYTDFFEYYWAHMMQGTTWEHVSSWLLDLLLRNPFTRVPRRVLHAWLLLWAISLVVIGLTVWGMWPKSEEPKPELAFISGLVGLAVSAFVSNVLIKRFGDVARYVKATPPNVAKRHSIRQAGVKLLTRLIDSRDYERIIVVAHSLGSIVAYDILAMAFDRYNSQFSTTAAQPERHKLEEMVRNALAGDDINIDAFQEQQAAALAEARAQGAPWIVSDFVTLGAPLTHAEFLMAESHSDLRARQASRLLPTCPPTFEYDGTTKLHHFTYSTQKGRKPLDPRIPHHAALFGYTRWTNIYSQEKAIVTGDLISGPVHDVFGLDGSKSVVGGVRDIAVLPKLDEKGAVAKEHIRSFFSHNNYWSLDKGTDWTLDKSTGTGTINVPHHIAELRRALRLLGE